MKQWLGMIAVVVREYDEAIAFYRDVLGFRVVEDRRLIDLTDESSPPAASSDSSEISDDGGPFEAVKRWVVVAPPGATETHVLLARAADAIQSARIGHQTGGRVSFFLYTDDFWRDYRIYQNRGVVFVRSPQVEAYGTVAVFQDLYGNLWDLLQPA